MDAQTPNAKITTWLAQLDDALAAGDAAKAAALFAPTSFWRDFVSFTWNLKTMEGPGEIREMLEATLGDAKPANWTLRGDAAEACTTSSA